MQKHHIGKKYGFLTITEELSRHISKNGRKRRRFLCKCECGVYKRVLLQNLVNGDTISCGCSRFHGKSHTQIYNSYKGMKERCNNNHHNGYNRYGGRGITVCDEWNKSNGFMSFYNWSMDNGYKKGLSIDRIDNDGNYEPSNCRWATIQQQSLNKSVCSRNKTGYVGVYWHKGDQRYRVRVDLNYKRKHIGNFKILRDAVIARNKFIIENNLPHKIQEFKG